MSILIAVAIVVAYLSAGLALVRWGPDELRGYQSDDFMQIAAIVIFGPAFLVVISPFMALGWLGKKVAR
ncbi:hypothetical protein AQJ23_44905 [Streptomyces antibioticus]|nr:hypothetical protein [Streptomyces antibioticus]KUN16537.1 hypothetical protein AQJ23_44905 [Streptomyces antibioticus]